MRVRDLYKLLNLQILAGNADKVIYLTNDDDWNWVHKLLFWIQSNKEEIEALDCYWEIAEEDKDNVIILD